MIWELQRDGKRVFEPFTKKMLLQEMIIDLVEMYLDGKIDQATFLALKMKLKEEGEISSEKRPDVSFRL